MHAFRIGIILATFCARAAGAGVCLLQTLHQGGFPRSAGEASETSSDVINEEIGEVDGDYLEVDIRRHHAPPKSFIDSRIRQAKLSGHSLVVPFKTGHQRQTENSSAPEPSRPVSAPEPSRPVPLDADEERSTGQEITLPGHAYTHTPEHLSAEQIAAAQQLFATSGASLAHPSNDAGGASLAHPSDAATGGSLAHPSARLPAHGMIRGLELMIGIMLGVLLSLLALTAMGYWSRKPVRSLLPAQAPMPNPGLSGGRLELVQFHYHGAWFMQFSWALDGSSGSSEQDPVCILSDNREVGRVLGRLMATPNGEMYVMSAASTWAVLKRPLPNRRPGQLWDFKVCRADGTPYAEVRQRSETKCHVDDAVTQRRIMTVIGNFTYPVFLSGERSIHVWLTQGSAKPSMCAQCEARPEMETEGLPPSSQSRRFHVTTTSNVDASLVLAILLGLQDVHGAAVRRAPAVAQSDSSERSAHSTGNFRVGAGPGLPPGTGAASSTGPSGTGATSSSNNGGQPGQSSGPSGQLQGSEEKPPEPPKATEPAMAA